MAAYDVRRFSVSFVPSAGVTEASGQLVVSAPQRPAATAALSLTASPTVPEWVTRVIVWPLVGAALLMLIMWLGTSPARDLTQRIGPVDWDFSASWASNITVFSALLGTILTAGVLPDETSSARVATYAGLNLLFGVGVLVGPFLYTALRGAVQVNKRSKTKEPQYQGWVSSFLLATIIVLWATAGEFFTMWQLFGEIRTEGSLPEAGFIAFRVLILAAATALVFLVWMRGRAILKSSTGEEDKGVRKRATHRRLVSQGVTNVTADEVEPALDAWPLY